MKPETTRHRHQEQEAHPCQFLVRPRLPGKHANSEVCAAAPNIPPAPSWPCISGTLPSSQTGQTPKGETRDTHLHRTHETRYPPSQVRRGQVRLWARREGERRGQEEGSGSETGN